MEKQDKNYKTNRRPSQKNLRNSRTFKTEGEDEEEEHFKNYQRN